MIFINCFVFARNMKLNFNSFWIVYLQEAEEKKTNFNLNSNRCSEIAAFEMTLVGFSYEYECTSNWEQSMTLFSLSPQVFAITWPPKKKQKTSLFFSRQSFYRRICTFPLSGHQRQERSGGQQHELHDKERWAIAAIDLHEKRSGLHKHEQWRVSPHEICLSWLVLSILR